MGVFATVNSPSGIHSKSTDKLKSMMSFREGTAEDREEGEIVDEYEDIISSDEEFSMRQRIEELEAKNAELEKIANISAIYANGNYDYTKKDSSSHHVDRYPLISINISDDEDYPPAPPMSRITKRRKSLQHSSSRRKVMHTPSNSGHRRRKKSASPPPAPSYRASDKLLLSMFHEKYAARSSSKKRRKNKKSHSAKQTRKLREYQYVSNSDDYTLDTYNLDVEDGYENYNSSDADTSFSINRDELRLALARNTHRHEQHVSLKDRLIRRKENTDTLNEKSADDVQEIVEVEDNSDSPQDKADTEDNMEEQELRIIALKSAVIRKHLVRKKRNENVAYSPSDFDEAYANISMSPSINIDDAEPCNSMEISPVPSPKLVISDDDGIDTKPVDMDIANSDSDCELSYEKWVPIEQIPLPNNMVMQDELYVPTPLRYNTNAAQQHFMPPDVRFETALDSPVNLESDVEEEELALRALLLAKRKVNKTVIEERPKVEETLSNDADISLEAEALRNFLISNMKKKSEKQNSSASVLKEAVRRLTARNANASPAENLAELSPSHAKFQSVSAFKMTLYDAENQLSRSTADLAKIQIGQPGLRTDKVQQDWTLWNTDEGYDEVKFCISPELESKHQLEANERGRDEMRVADYWDDAVSPQAEKGVIQEEVNQKSPNQHEIEAKGSSLVAIVDKPKKESADVSGNDIKSGNSVDFVSVVDSKSSDVEICDKESPVVHVQNTVPISGNKNQADLISNEEVQQNDRQTTEIQVISDPDGKEGETRNKIVQFKKPTKEAATCDAEVVIKHSSTEMSNSINQVEVKKETVKNAESSATTNDANVKTVEIKEPSVTMQNKVKLSDSKVKKDATTVAPKAVKSSLAVSQVKVECHEAPVPSQQKPSTKAKKDTVLNVCKVAKPLAIAGGQVKVNSGVKKTIVPQQNKAELNGTEIKLSSTKAGNENTATAKTLITKLKPKVEKPEKPIKQQSFPAKLSTLAQNTQKSVAKSSAQQSTKIVKPNKVINTRVTDLKRTLTDNTAKPTVPLKIVKLDEPSNRLITAAEMPQVKKLVIQLRDSDSESDYSALSADGNDDENDLDARDRDFMNRSITIGNEYYDIASPISLPMESPCDTPTRTASPIASVTPTPQPIVEKSIVNDFFEAQLDKFLKNVRSKVAESSKNPVGVEESTPPALSTPVAVRHLPEASQQEYRRLINRMKMLERQKQAKNLQIIVKNTSTLASAETRTVMGEGESLVRKVLVKNASVNTAKPTCQVKVPQKHVPQKPKTPEIVEKPSAISADAVQNLKVEKSNLAVALPKMSTPSLAKSAPGAAMPKSSISKSKASPTISTPSPSSKPVASVPKQSNEKLLVLYEKSYRETGNSIISNLDRSIEMVLVAKKAKMEKLKHEHRLMELRKEMEEVQRNIRQQQERITKIYPEICNSHRMIETLKTRRVKIHKDVTAFGKRVVGQSYSMNNDQKSVISEKSKKLVAEIKLVNNMKLSDIEKWENAAQPTRTDVPSENINVPAPVQMPVIENDDSLICPAHDKVPVDDSKTAAIETPLSEATSRIEPDLTNTVVPETIVNEQKKEDDQTDQKDSTNGHEEALEKEIDDDKPAHNSKDDVEETVGDRDEHDELSENCENEQVGGTKLQDYVSPLGHMRDERQINPNGIVCPYQLMGQCGDKDCKYMHLDN